MAQSIDMARLTLTVEEQLRRRFKSACSAQGFTMAEISERLITGWLDGKISLPLAGLKQPPTDQSS